jgi:hypothetical protein
MFHSISYSIGESAKGSSFLRAPRDCGKVTFRAAIHPTQTRSRLARNVADTKVLKYKASKFVKKPH